MKSLFISQIRTLVILAILLASARFVQAQWSISPTATNNIYSYSPSDGVQGSSGSSSLDPAPEGVPFGTQHGVPMPANGIFSFSYSSSTTTESINFMGTDPQALGTTLNLTYTGTGQAELRLDWDAFYQNTSGSSITLPTTYSILVTEDADSYAAVAGEETFFGGSGPEVEASIPAFGSLSLPNGPWYGSATSGSHTFNISPTVSGSTTIANQGYVSVYGYLDLVVDPGSIEVQIEPVPEPGMAALSLAGAFGMVCLRMRNRRK